MDSDQLHIANDAIKVPTKRACPIQPNTISERERAAHCFIYMCVIDMHIKFGAVGWLAKVHVVDGNIDLKAVGVSLLHVLKAWQTVVIASSIKCNGP